MATELDLERMTDQIVRAYLGNADNQQLSPDEVLNMSVTIRDALRRCASADEGEDEIVELHPYLLPKAWSGFDPAD